MRRYDESLRIISDSDFQKVQDLLASRAGGKALTKARHHYTFGGMQVVKCGHCGAYMVGRTTVNHGKEHREYYCPNHVSGTKSCPTKAIRHIDINNAALIPIAKDLLKKTNLKTLNEFLAVKTVDDVLAYRLNELNSKIKNIAASLEVTFSKELALRLTRLESERKGIEDQIAAQNANTALVLTAKELRRSFKKLKEFLAESTSIEVREFLQTVVKEIKVDNENVSVVLNLG